ncbi:MAG: M20/M25/M40 family metallo-hydrolase, partial [Candidatus Hodarchaeales archaeon]|jgi:endoglucanase
VKTELQPTLDYILDFAKDLLTIPGISGHEDEVASYFCSKLGNYGTPFRDSIGNCYVRLGNNQSDFKMLVTAHMDSVGFVVKEIKDDQEVDVLPVGIHRLDQYHNSEALAVGEKSLTKGLILAENEKEPKFIVNRGETTISEAAIDIGDQIIAVNPMEVQPTTKTLKGCWLDNRLGLSVLMSLAKEIDADFPAEILLVASVQEEIGAKGVEAVLRTYDPDVAIVIDATWTQPSVLRGQGPVLTVLDPSVCVRPSNRRFITNLASDSSIPLQKEVLNQGASDAGPLNRAGIPTFCIMIPVDGLHTPAEVVSLDDLGWNFLLVKSLLFALKPHKKKAL